jgi:hypothetical protein
MYKFTLIASPAISFGCKGAKIFCFNLSVEAMTSYLRLNVSKNCF